MTTLNYNPVYVFPELRFNIETSIFFKIFIVIMVLFIIFIAYFCYPFEIIFFYNYLMNNINFTSAELSLINTANNNLINLLTPQTLVCNANSNLTIKSTGLVLNDINNNPIICNDAIIKLYSL